MSKEDIVDQALDQTKEELSEQDSEKHLIKAVKTLEVVEGSINEKEERFRDWYSLHFPELVDEIRDIGQLAKILDDSVQRDDLEAFSEMAESSNGSEMGEKQKEIIETVLEDLNSNLELRDKLESYIKSSVKEEMPNLSKLLDPIIAAQILAQAGGLDELAKMPASTVQMLGAEKALFRYLRGNGTPPKHGILFEHEFVRPLPSNPRGKMARFLANKTVMAARLDNYGDKDKGEDLRQEARQKFQELKGE
jgi:nucleolar protein 56